MASIKSVRAVKLQESREREERGNVIESDSGSLRDGG